MRAPEATPATAGATGLLLPLLARGMDGGPASLLFAGLAFAALLLGVIGTELPAATLAGRHLSAFAWPRDARGTAILRRAALRLAALTGGLILMTLILALTLALAATRAATA